MVSNGLQQGNYEIDKSYKFLFRTTNSGVSLENAPISLREMKETIDVRQRKSYGYIVYLRKCSGIRCKRK